MAQYIGPRSQSPTYGFPSKAYLFSCIGKRREEKGLDFGPKTDKVIEAAAKYFGSTKQTAEWVDRNSRFVVEKEGLPPATSMYDYEKWGRNVFVAVTYCQRKAEEDAKKLSGQDS